MWRFHRMCSTHSTYPRAYFRGWGWWPKKLWRWLICTQARYSNKFTQRLRRGYAEDVRWASWHVMACHAQPWRRHVDLQVFHSVCGTSPAWMPTVEGKKYCFRSKKKQRSCTFHPRNELQFFRFAAAAVFTCDVGIVLTSFGCGCIQIPSSIDQSITTREPSSFSLKNSNIFLLSLKRIEKSRWGTFLTSLIAGGKLLFWIQTNHGCSLEMPFQSKGLHWSDVFRWHICQTICSSVRVLSPLSSLIMIL